MSCQTLFLNLKKSSEKEPEGPYPISVVNISAGGIRLKLKRKFKKEVGFDIDNPPMILIFFISFP